MDKELLEILVCPKSKKKLILAPVDLVKKVNNSIQSGNCIDLSGEAVTEPVEEGLYQPETHTFYMIRDGIPLLIYANAIITDNL